MSGCIYGGWCWEFKLKLKRMRHGPFLNEMSLPYRLCQDITQVEFKAIDKFGPCQHYRNSDWSDVIVGKIIMVARFILHIKIHMQVQHENHAQVNYS